MTPLLRIVYLAVLVFGLVLSLGGAAAPDWSATATRKADGAFVIGNPAARIKLVEYVSYTCPHCAEFVDQSRAVLKNQFVRSGSTSVEIRHALLNKFDIAATITARCAGPRGFAPVTDALFAAQADWLGRAMRYDRFNGRSLEQYSLPQQLRAYADASGISDIARENGLTDAQMEACFADQAEIDRVVAMSNESWKAIDSTPSFVLNGQKLSHIEWAQLEPKLRAAGAR